MNSDTGMSAYAVDASNNSYVNSAQGNLIKPLLIPPLDTDHVYRAAQWFSHTLLPAVNRHYATDKQKSDNLRVIVTYFSNDARQIIDTWMQDQTAHNDPTLTSIALVKNWDNLGNPIAYTTWQQFKNWFFSPRGFGFESPDEATRALDTLVTKPEPDIKHYCHTFHSYLHLFVLSLLEDNPVQKIATSFIRAIADQRVREKTVERWTQLDAALNVSIAALEATGKATPDDYFNARFGTLQELVQFPQKEQVENKSYHPMSATRAADIHRQALEAFSKPGNDYAVPNPLYAPQPAPPPSYTNYYPQQGALPIQQPAHVPATPVCTVAAAQPQPANPTVPSNVPDWTHLFNNSSAPQPPPAQSNVNPGFTPMLPTVPPDTAWAQQMQACFANYQLHAHNTGTANQAALMSKLDMIAQNQHKTSSRVGQLKNKQSNFSVQCKLCNQPHGMKDCTHSDSYASQIKRGVRPSELRSASGKIIHHSMLRDWMILEYNSLTDTVNTTLDDEKNKCYQNFKSSSSNTKSPQVDTVAIGNIISQQMNAMQQNMQRNMNAQIANAVTNFQFPSQPGTVNTPTANPIPPTTNPYASLEHPNN